MTPFLQLRLWLRRAPAAERLLAGAATVVVVGLLAWALVPGGGSGTSVSATGGAGSGGQQAAAAPGSKGATTSAGGAAPAAGGGTAALSASSGAASAGGSAGGGSGAVGGGPAAPGTGAGQGSGPTSTSGACGALRATDQGVTASQIHIGVVVVDFEGQMGNGLFGFPAPAEQQGYYQAIIDAINRSGGIQCRKLVATFYSGNPLDQNEEHSTCLKMAQDQLFAAVSIGFYNPPSQDCPAANKIPTVISVPVPPPESNQYYPYLFTVNANWQQLIHNYAQAMNQDGWFKGANKVGLLEVDCQPELNDYMVADLARIGVPKSKLVTFDYGCNVGVQPPNEVEQAVLEFKTAGVTHVVDVNSITLNYFSRQAQQQAYHPKYSFPDGASILAYDSQGLAPDPNNFDGALGITASQFGALQTPGVPVSPATKTCDQIMAGAHLPSAEQSGDSASGIACDGVWMLQAAMTHDPGLVRTGLAAGLDQSGQPGFSYPQGPVNFSGTRVVTGGEYWRPAVFVGSCSCFRVTDPEFKPSFP